jgi:hypothetical protein
MKYPIVKDEGNHCRNNYGNNAPDETPTQLLEVTEESQPFFAVTHFVADASPGLLGWSLWPGMVGWLVANGASTVFASFG